MLGFGKRNGAEKSPRVSAKLCTDRFNGKYPHVGLYDCRHRKVWVAKPLSGQAIRTAHAALITGVDNATSTVWKDRFLCFWFYTPRTGEGYIHGYPIDWDEAHLLVRIDPQWDYDRQRRSPQNCRTRSTRTSNGKCTWRTDLGIFSHCSLKYPMNLHFIGQRAADSQFYVKRKEAASRK